MQNTVDVVVVRETVSKILESEQNSNSIIDLLECLQISENPDVIRSVIEGLSEVFTHYLSLHYQWFNSGIKEGQPTSDIEDITYQYSLWIKSKYQFAVQKLLEFLHDSTFQDLALIVLMRLVQHEGKCHQKSTPQKTYNFPNHLFVQIVSKLLTLKQDTRDLIGQFVTEYMDYSDVKYYTLKNTASLINSRLDLQKKKQEPLDPWLMENVHHLLQQITMTNKGEIPDHFLAGNPRDTDGKRVHNVCSIQKCQSVFTNCWLAFLQLPLSPTVHKNVLVSLHSSVMPYLTKPRLLVDFLVGSYDQGGVYSILALDGLFILMHQYHLDYPNFYQNLYTLFQPSIFQVKYMSRFFKLVDVFLSSTHLPLYLVAAFAKRIARLALTAPPKGVMVAGVMVMNLIKRHPNCRVLLHRSNTEVFEVDTDPYKMEETDPAQCRALESCLWELKTLQNHYHPDVSNLISCLLDPENQSRSRDLQHYLDKDVLDVFEIKCQGKVPLNFTEPEDLWSTWT